MSQNAENTENNKTVQSNNKTVAKNEQKKKKSNIAKLINLVVLVIVLGGLFWVVKSYFNFGNDKYTNAAQVESFINPINTRVSAYIKEIRFVEHQPVKKGDTLLILDNREILTQVGQAEAAYMAALASKNVTSQSVNTASNNVNTVGANVQAAIAGIKAAKARLWNAEQNFKRYQNLLKDEAVTRQQFDQIKTEYEAQKAQLEVQIAQLQSVVNTKSSSELTVNEVKSRLGMNDAEIKRAENALEMAKVRTGSGSLAVALTTFIIRLGLLIKFPRNCEVKISL